MLPIPIAIGIVAYLLVEPQWLRLSMQLLGIALIVVIFFFLLRNIRQRRINKD